MAQSLASLETKPRLLVAHFVGIDRIAHIGGGNDEIRDVASAIDGHLKDLAAAISEMTMMVICGDHPLHAGKLKGVFDSKHVALIIWKKGRDFKADHLNR